MRGSESTDLLSPRVVQGTNHVWPGLTGGFFPAVVGEMLIQGFTPAGPEGRRPNVSLGGSPRR